MKELIKKLSVACGTGLVIRTYMHTSQEYLLSLFQNDGKSGDAFMNQIQPIASAIPYMISPGNHEFKE